MGLTSSDKAFGPGHLLECPTKRSQANPMGRVQLRDATMLLGGTGAHIAIAALFQFRRGDLKAILGIAERGQAFEPLWSRYPLR